MAGAGGALVGGAPQHRDDLLGAEALAPLPVQAHDGGEQLLHGHRRVPAGRRVQAGVAVAARGGLLPEVAQDLHPAAVGGLAQGEHRVQVGPLHPPVLLAALGFVDHPPQLHHVLQPVGQPGGGGQPVASGAPGLLVVALHGLGQVQVGDEAHVGFVDPHPEGDGRDHDHPVLAQEPTLALGPLRLGHPGVVGHRIHPLVPQPGGGLLDAASGQAVDDAGLAVVLGADQAQQLLAGGVLLGDAVLDVGPVEAGDEVLGPLQRQALGQLPVGRGGGGGGQGDARDPGEALGQHGQPEVVLPEVVAPLGDAVRLVDREQGQARPAQQVQGALLHEPLGGEVEQVVVPGQQSALHGSGLFEVQGGVQVRGADAHRLQGLHLVLHQRDQRGDDDAGAFPQDRRDLVAQGLPAAGGHQHDGVAPGGDPVDDRGLVPAEGVVAEDGAQDLQGRILGGVRVLGCGVRAGPRGRRAGVGGGFLAHPSTVPGGEAWGPFGHSGVTGARGSGHRVAS